MTSLLQAPIFSACSLWLMKLLGPQEEKSNMSDAVRKYFMFLIFTCRPLNPPEGGL